MTNKKITNDDLINSLSEERQTKIKANIEKEVAKWGGKRENSGRKRITGQILNFTKKVTAEEAEFIDYVRKNNLNLNDLKHIKKEA